ncbi:MAG: PD-(D/E)XK nuclease family protein [Synergistaceae bacterium]|nr:PD-(D/E)XK nuclease family protein [Synergistaceae bacterium]
MQTPNKFSIIDYYQIKDLLPYLAKFFKDNGEQGVFVVPQSLDKGMLRKLLLPSSFFVQPPRILTLGELYQEVAEACGTEPLFVIDPPDHTLILKFLVKNFIARCEAEHIDLPSGVLQSGFVTALGDELHELITEDVSPEEFEKRLNLSEEVNLTPEKILYCLYKDYRNYHESHGITDVFSVPHHTRHLITMNKKAVEYLSAKNFFFVGFMSLTGSQLALVREVSRHTAGRVMIGAPKASIADFNGIAEQIGIFDRTSADYSRQRRERKNLVFHASSYELEAGNLARQIALWRNNRGRLFDVFGNFGSLSEVGLVCSGANLALFRSAFNRYKIPWNEEEISTVADNLVGRLPRLIWQTYESNWQETNARAFLSSFIFSDIETGNLFVLPRNVHPLDRAAWEEFLTDDAKFVVEKATDFYEVLKNGTTPSNLLSSYYDFLDEIKLGDRVIALTNTMPDLDNIAKVINNSIFEVGKKAKYMADLAEVVGQATNEFLTGRDALDFFSSWASVSTLPVTGSLASCVTIWTKVPPVFTSRKYFIIADCDANHYPKTMRESELLSPEAREIFNKNIEEADILHISHIPSMAEKRLQEEAIFRRLIETAESGLIFSRTMADRENRPVFASPFLSRFLNLSSQEAEKIIYRVTLDDLLPHNDDDRLNEAEASRDALLETDIMPSLMSAAEKVPYIKPSHIESARCPLKYYLENLLYLDDERVQLLDVRAMGNLMHALFEDGFDALENGVSKSLLEFIEKNLESYAQRIQFGKPIYPALFTDPRLAIEADNFKKNLFEMARYLDSLEKGDLGKARIKMLREETLDFEDRLPMSDTEKSHICHIKGKADRIDFFGDKAVIIDYKSSEAEHHKADLQLPLYAVIWSLLHPESDVNGIAWLGLKSAYEKPMSAYYEDKKQFEAYYKGDKNVVGSRTTLDDRKKEAVEVTANIVEHLVEGNEWKPVYKINGKDNPACQYCKYKPICRKQAVENE